MSASYESILAELNLDDDINIADFSSFISAIDYQGFNAKILLKKLKTKESDVTVLRTDIVKMIWLFLHRGNAADRMHNTSSHEAKNAIRHLFSKYDVKPNLWISKGPEVITLSRIATALPRVTLSILDSDLSISKPGMCTAVALLPRTMMSIVACSAIPLGKPYSSTLFRAVCVYLYCEKAVLKKGLSQNGKTEQERVFHYAKVALKSSILNDQERITLAKKYKWINSEGITSASITMIANNTVNYSITEDFYDEAVASRN